MKRMLGIEGGGTKTEWIYSGPEGDERSGRLPGSNLRLVSDERLEAMLRTLPREATHVGIFLAGCVTQADRSRLADLVAGIWPQAHRMVGSDRESGFAAAFREGDGVAVIAGTGSAITGRVGGPQGRYEKAGGWGQLLGDKGSGYDIAMQALRKVLWRYDLTRRIAPPAEKMLARLGLNQLDELVGWVQEAGKMEVAQLAPVVFEAAAAGDEELAAVVDAGAHLLADGAAAVAGRLGLAAPEVRLQGGLFVAYPAYAARFAERLHAALPEANVALCTESGAAGALWLAAQEWPQPQTAEPPEVDLEELANAWTEQANPRSSRLEVMSTPEVVDLFIAEEDRVREALETAREPLIAGIELVADALRHGGRLFYVGAGTSGRLGVLDASEIPPTFGESPERVQAIMAGGVSALYRSVEGAEDEPQAGALAVVERGVRPGDVVCGLTASGRTPFVLGALRQARLLGARTMLMTCNPARRRETAWEVEVDLATGPELLTGSTRLKAGTATKCALNLLSTGAMIRLGRVQGNLMAGVRVSNAKLRDRAVRLVSAVRGVERGEAEALLAGCDWEVRRALAES